MIIILVILGVIALFYGLVLYQYCKWDKEHDENSNIKREVQQAFDKLFNDPAILELMKKGKKRYNRDKERNENG